MWAILWPWLVGATVVLLAAAALWLTLRRPKTAGTDDLRNKALDLWLAGDHVGARDTLREYVRDNPHDTESSFQLAALMRLTGEPGRAAALHQSLAVRRDLSPWRRLTTGLGLAEGFIDLKRYEDAATALDEVAELATRDVRWYRLRFAVAVRREHPDVAADVLRSGEKRLTAEPAAELKALRAAWLTDRTLQLVHEGDIAGARNLLRKTRGLEPAAGRVHLIRAMIAAAENDPDQAVRAVSDGLSSYPAEMAPAMRLLEGVLLDTGRFTRVIPILEAACRDETAPAELWASLARLYEKLGRRDDALRLLASKRGDPRLTPDALAPYLRLLTAEVPDAAFSRVWNLLSDPSREHGYSCRLCGRQEPSLRWFCSGCLAPDSFDAAVQPAATLPAVTASPPRY